MKGKGEQKRKHLCMSKKKMKLSFFADEVNFLRIAQAANEKMVGLKMLLPLKQDFLVFPLEIIPKSIIPKVLGRHYMNQKLLFKLIHSGKMNFI